MAFNAQRARLVADRQIRRLGGRTGALRRGGVSRQVMIALVSYSKRDVASGLALDSDRKGVLSTFKPDRSDMTPAPDNEVDVLDLYTPGTTTVAETWSLVGPPNKIDPNGVIILWELQLRGK